MDDQQTPSCFSPDSGVVCDMELEDKPPTPCLLDPPQRRLSKSLSADSEWSLDPSLFEAEDFLRDMGFAGAGDPTIPDRFIPSLMQRLARFPESEMESLHDRIIQSIGCFRRKEGKRRLFRNFSMGKDARRFLGCQHPFIRSNTDPSSFPYDETSNSTSSLSLSSSSNDRTHSLASSNSDLPESPIAILVSEASVDHEQQTVSRTVDAQKTTVNENHEKKTSDNLVHSEAPVSDSVDKLTSSSVDYDQHTTSKTECNQNGITSQGQQAGIVIAALQVQLDHKSDSFKISEKSVQADISMVDESTHQPSNDVPCLSIGTARLSTVDSKSEGTLVSQLGDNFSQSDDDTSFFDGYISQLGTFGLNYNSHVSQLEDNMSQPVDDVLKSCDSVSSHGMVATKDDGPYSEQNVHDWFKLDGGDAVISQFEDICHDKIQSKNGDDVSQFDSGVPQSADDFTQTDDEVSSVYLDSLELDDKEFKDSSYYKMTEFPNHVSLNFSENSHANNVLNENNNVVDNKRIKIKSLYSKTPLRRTSNGIFGSFQNQNDIEMNCPANTVQEVVKVKNTFHNNMWTRNFSELDDRSIDGVKVINESAIISSAGFFQSESATNIVPLKNMPHDMGNIKSRSKPKYSRDNSLTNFLSSMLDTSGASGRSPIPVRKTIAEKNSNSDSEVPGSFATTPFNSFASLDTNSKFTSNVDTKINATNSKPTKSYLKVQELIDKAPNRKRRMLRRMSSSLQCCDDLNCDSNVINTGSCNDGIPTAPYIETNQMPQMNHVSEPSRHRPIFSCNSLPVSDFYRGCDFHCETDNCQTNLPRKFCACDSKTERNVHHSIRCKRKRNLSCPFPEVSFGSRTSCKPKTILCSCMTYRPNCTDDVHKRLSLSCNLCTKEAFSSCGCLCRNSNCRLNFKCSGSQCNVFHSSNAGNCDHNVQCLVPSSPSFLRPDNLLSNFWNQSRQLCYSSPDLTQDCCTNPFERCNPTSFINNDSCTCNFLEQCDQNSFQEDCNLAEKLPSKNPNMSCSFHLKQHLPKLESQAISKSMNRDIKCKMTIRNPKRQDSISIADSDIQSHTLLTNSNNLPNLFPSSKQNSKKDFDPQPTITYADALNKNVPKTSSTEVSSNELKSDSKSSLTFKLEEPKEISDKNPSSPTTKNEALLERKIRIFSKFLANLGNLSKSISDTGTDNKHKRTFRDQKCSDVPNVDKKTKPCSPKVSCPVLQARRRSVPELGKLLDLLKTMETGNKNFERVLDLNGTPKFSEKSPEKLCEIEYPVYENTVQLQASKSTGEEQRILYKPVMYSSSVSLYINAEDKTDIQKERNKDVPGIDKEPEGASPKKEHLLHRSLSQMSFKGVSKEIEDVQLSIQKAKEMRMCASKELHLLQELLSVDVTGEQHRTAKNKMRSDAEKNICEKDSTSKSSDGQHNQALADLREKSKREVLEDTSFWKEEIEKVKEETKKAWQAKLDRLEARLASQEDELRRLQGETINLSKTNENGRTDSAFEDDDERRPTTPLQCRRVDCERLQRRLVEEEQRADQLNLMLNQKSIELNKLQIQLSRQTKEMIELEKSYLQLQCRLRRGTSKPLVSRLCSRASPFSPKNLKPPSPPPPSNGTT